MAQLGLCLRRKRCAAHVALVSLFPIVFCGHLFAAAEPSTPLASIQAAIDAATVGAVVHVPAGFYRESLTIERPVTLEGEGWDRTVLIAPPRGSASPAPEATAGPPGNGRAQAGDSVSREPNAPPDDPQALILVHNTDGVVIRGLRLGLVQVKGTPQPPLSAALRVADSRVSVVDCCIAGDFQRGVVVSGVSDFEMRRSLVTLTQTCGVSCLGHDTTRPLLRLLDCEIRNFGVTGVRLRNAADGTVIAGSRFTGHGLTALEYQDCNPIVLDNAFLGKPLLGASKAPEERDHRMLMGISSKGESAAVVSGNLFLRLRAYGVVCGDTSRGVFVRNTFCGSATAFGVLDKGQPIVASNIFRANGIGWQDVGRTGDRDSTDAVAAPAPVQNIFWQNDLDAVRFVPSVAYPGTFESENVPLEGTHNLVADPMLLEDIASGFAPAPGSVAQRLGVGASGPLHLESRWPDLIEENAPLMESLKAR